jgi:hypothetical protein
MFLVKVFTGDYGTHLAIGRKIWETRSLPVAEFLTYPALGAPHAYTEWGFQALLYGVFTIGGTAGVSLLCWVVTTGTLYLLFLSARVRGAHPWVAAFALFAFAGLLRIRIQPRPEIFAYLFLAATIYLFSGYYFGTRKKALWALPPIVAVWANLHPSFLLAFVVSGFFFADAVAAAAVRKHLAWAHLRKWVFPPVAITALALLCSGINPYGFSHLLAPVGLAKSEILAASITEMASIRITSLFPVFLGAAALGGTALLLGLWGRHVRLLDLLMLGFALKASYSAARGIAMIPVLLVPGAAVQATAFLERVLEGEEAPGRVGKGFRWAASSLAFCGALALGIYSCAISLTGVEYGIGMTEHKYSFPAAEFVRRTNPPGKMFNFFDIGGFLGWQLYGQKLTFIDGRGAAPGVYMDYNTVVAGFDGWDRILDRYGAELIVTKAVDSTGMVLPLIDRLLGNRRWALVFSDGLALVFLKDTPGNAAIIRRYEIPKRRVYHQIIEEARHELHLGSPKRDVYIAMGNAYASLGNYEEGVRAFRKALEYGESSYARSAVRMFAPKVNR